MSEKIAVIGTGYVGLVSGTCFADVGHQVVCVDRDAAKIERLKQAIMPIYEPGLDELVDKNMKAGRLTFTTSIGDAVRQSDIVIIAVGTPAMENGDVDMSQVKAAVIEVAENLNGYKIIINKSTVPVGTAKLSEELIREHRKEEHPFDIVSTPEFLREGTAVYDTFHLDRIVIGADNPEAAERVKQMHEPFQAPVLITNRESSELIKYASNSFLAAKISFINEMSNVCEKVGADVTMVAQGMGMDKRIGKSFLNAGIGYGGFCLPKDTKAQLKIAENVDYDFKIMRAVIDVNQQQRELFVEKIERVLGGSVAGKKIAALGLTFKPDTDDMRDAPSIDVIHALQEKGADVRAFDPVAAGHVDKLFPGMPTYTDPYQAIEGADAAVIITEWAQVKELDLNRVKALLTQPVIIDGRNQFVPEQMRELGFVYVSVGRP